jgi:hypothetical protein
MEHALLENKKIVHNEVGMKYKIIALQWSLNMESKLPKRLLPYHQEIFYFAVVRVEEKLFNQVSMFLFEIL